ncbi:alpha/beta fold hydrolase [Haladaptatus salinisoli]|uniref:alpha/beta fold hydrolase n=1 Tax=Haladaptatus salinisoli TaxID=2884876 RepID=UPI001D0A63E4|nr:alpha/beta hydrolase [Haladaptatus salinisoli]
MPPRVDRVATASERCDGAELYFAEAGEGTPIVFLPGVTIGIRFFAPQVADLSDDFRTVALDYRSGDLERLAGTLEPVQTDRPAFIERLVGAAFKEPPSDETRTLALDELSRTPPPIASAILLDYAARDYRDALPDIDVPTLVRAGADEKWRTVAAVKDVADRVPNAEFELFEESGRCITPEESDEFSGRWRSSSGNGRRRVGEAAMASLRRVGQLFAAVVAVGSVGGVSSAALGTAALRLRRRPPKEAAQVGQFEDCEEDEYPDDPAERPHVEEHREEGHDDEPDRQIDAVFRSQIHGR